MSASHGYSTMGGIEYGDGDNNGLWKCQSIDVNARSRDCHATDAVVAISF